MDHTKEHSEEQQISEEEKFSNISDNSEGKTEEEAFEQKDSKEIGEEIKFGEQSDGKVKDLNPNPEVVDEDIGNNGEEEETDQEEEEPQQEEEQYNKDDVQGGPSEPSNMVNQNRIQNRFVSKQYN